jgi:uncharacterized protein YpmS
MIIVISWLNLGNLLTIIIESLLFVIALALIIYIIIFRKSKGATIKSISKKEVLKRKAEQVTSKERNVEEISKVRIKSEEKEKSKSKIELRPQAESKPEAKVRPQAESKPEPETRSQAEESENIKE